MCGGGGGGGGGGFNVGVRDIVSEFIKLTPTLSHISPHTYLHCTVSDITCTQ